MSNDTDLRELTIADLVSVRCGGGASVDDDLGSKGKAKAKVRGDEGEEYENSGGTIKGDGVLPNIPGTLPSFP
ncbi:MAG: hypothetical protein K0V04_40710 [Deltaproteobacteria bacterium]|nr:hypothetical protein [Deltaproteobacteria bacterium]